MKRIIQTLASILLLTSAHAYAQSTLYIQSEAGDYIGQGQTYLYQAPANSFTVTRSWNQGIDVAVSD